MKLNNLFNAKPENIPNDAYTQLTHCPYCRAAIIKKGKRKNKYEDIQRYYCNSCKKTFTSAITKHKKFPLKVILDSLTLYNRLHSTSEISSVIKERYGISLSSQTIPKWLKEYEKYTPFLRMREFASKKYSKKELIEESKLFHKQLYSFKYHRAKLSFILNEEFSHNKFFPLQQFLELVNAECPNQIFQNSTKRASEFQNIFNLNEVSIIPKHSTASQLANFVCQAVSNNKLRHEILQDFMLSNDSVTVAVEVPVMLNSEDISHYKYELNFNVPIQLSENEYLTGHIDMLQVRNGSVYILDYKPNAKKSKPVEQLTLYALALSRLTGLRLYHFKCAWFDKDDYFEFFPLHVVYKLKEKRIPRAQKRLEY